MRKKLFVWIILAFLFACKSSTQKEETKNSGRVADVAITEVKTQEFNHYIEVQGRVDGEENVGVSARAMGVITDVFVSAGDAVKKGQVLAQIDDQQMQQALKEIQTQIDLATSLFNKQKNLWDQKIGSEVQYLSAKTNKESLENRKATMIEQIDMYKITSPIDGSVEDKSVKVGQSVAPGLPLFRIINFFHTKVVADVAESYTARIKKGNDVFVYFPDLGKDIPAKLDFSSKYINPTNRTFSIEINLQPGDIEYRANMIAVIKIKDYTNPVAVALPVNYIQTEMNDKYVFTVEKQNNNYVAKKQLVKLGQSYNGIVEITEGLKTGDKIISAGYQNIEEGQSVKF